MTGRDVGYAILSGLLLGSAYPPFRFEALVWISLVPLLWSLDRKRPHEAFALGFLMGLVSYGIIIWWVKPTMVSYGNLSPWLAWFITLTLAAYLALYPGMFCYFIVRISPGGGLPVFLIAGPLWVSLEVVRAYFLSGFPWALLGYSQYRILPVIQVADLFGVYGVSFFIVAVNAALWHFFRHPHRAPFRVIGGTALLAAFILGYGYLRLHEVPREAGPAERPVGIVQGNINQSQKWSPKAQASVVGAHEKLTKRLGEEFRKKPNRVPPLIVWPEAAAPFIYGDQPFWQSRMRETARSAGAYLLFGTLSAVRTKEGPQLYNSAYLIGPSGEAYGRYDKLHLVPFGEYVPLGPLLYFVKKLVPVIGTFAEGKKPRVFDVPGGKFGVLICFEAIFPRVVRRFRDAQFLVNITNDAWFGRTAASEQHLSMVAMRAVEFRVPIVRAANSGISAFIDARGAIRGRSPLFVPWSRTGVIAPRRGGPTLYARTGDLFAFACLLLSLAAFLAARRRRRVWYN
ncbi:MAG: apolipoprotein N-acyltransferase, partial [bacterium]